MRTTVIYLIHFETPFKHAKHYLGSTASMTNRMHDHRSGNGGKLMAAIKRAGILWFVVRTWKGNKQDDRKIKRRSHVPRLCPVCNPKVQVEKLHL